MKPVLIAYATREGQTRAIAEHVAESLRARGVESTAIDVREAHGPLPLEAHSAVILAASIHAHRHEKEMERLLAEERDSLARLPTAFLSVSLAEAGVEDPSRPAEHREKAARELAEITDALFEKTGFHPDLTQPVAGALMYSRYNALVRWVMKRIAASQGASTDTRRDHVYTDWDALDRFVDEFLAGVSRAPN